MDSYLRDLIQGNFAQGFTAMLFFSLLMLWSFLWKGLGLWNSAKNGDMYWFIAILVLNTAGVVEIFYLFVYSKNKMTISGIKKDLTNLVKNKKIALKRSK
mgnify:CR=1 FL=1